MSGGTEAWRGSKYYFTLPPVRWRSWSTRAYFYTTFHKALCSAYGQTDLPSLLSAVPPLCVTNIWNQVNKIPYFYFICTPRCILKMYRNWTDRISSYIFFSKWTLDLGVCGNWYMGKKETTYRYVMCQCFFFYVLYQSVNIYDNSMQRNASKLFLLDGERACLLRTGDGFLLYCCVIYMWWNVFVKYL